MTSDALAILMTILYNVTSDQDSGGKSFICQKGIRQKLPDFTQKERENIFYSNEKKVFQIIEETSSKKGSSYCNGSKLTMKRFAKSW